MMQQSKFTRITQIFFFLGISGLIIAMIMTQNQTEAGGALQTPSFLPIIAKQPTLTPTPTNTSTPTATPTPTFTPTPAAPMWVDIVTEYFEGNFPSGWQVSDEYPGEGEYHWKKRNCRASQGNNSGWAVGGGSNGSNLSCGSNYPNYAYSWMVYGPFSLNDASDAEMTFDLWLNTEYGYDVLCRLASINGSDFYGSCTTGDSNGWIDRTLDLSNVPDLGDLTGRNNVWIAIMFYSDFSIRESEGAYVDSVRVRKFVGAASNAETIVTTTESASEPEGLMEEIRHIVLDEGISQFDNSAK